MTLAINPSVFFGWSRLHPPEPEQYRITPQERYMVRDRQAGEDVVRPTPLLIDHLVATLNNPEGPRFALITGLKKQWQLSAEQIYRFQADVMEQLGERLGLRLRTDRDPYLDGLSSSKYPHFDGDGGIPVISLAYGPFKGLAKDEAIPRLADMKQWMDDAGRMKLMWMFKSFFRGFDRRQMMTEFMTRWARGLNGAAQDSLQTGYSIELDQVDFETDMPLIFINNDLETGVAHGATPLHGEKPGKARPLVREYLIS